MELRKLLLILFIIPTFIYGQDVPLTEKKVTTESMENRDRKIKEKADDKVRKENTKSTNKYNRSLAKYNRSLAMHPKNQIGYITNFTSHPWGGLNFFNHYSQNMGFYIDCRPSGNNLHLNNYTGTASYEGEYTSFNEYLWTSVINIGLSFRISNSRNTVFMMYGGVGSTSTRTYSGYDYYPSGIRYVEDGEVITKANFNFGILRQTDALISMQIGFDSAVPGINIGMGYTWD